MRKEVRLAEEIPLFCREELEREFELEIGVIEEEELFLDEKPLSLNYVIEANNYVIEANNYVDARGCA